MTGSGPEALARGWALGVEYDGSAFHGWQRQKGVASVQQTLEEALARIAGAEIKLLAAGRTDTGVHATGQVAAFTSPVTRPARAWVQGTNAHCPPSVRVRWATPVADSFSARYTAVSRRYLYLLHDAPGALARRFCWGVGGLDDERMHRAAQSLLGEQDFSAFRGAGCQADSPVRLMHRLAVTRRGSLVVVDVTANAFLLHMVRNLVGSLVEVGLGRRPEQWLETLLQGRDRTRAARTAPPDGLYLVHVAYPGYHFPGPSLPPLLSAVGSLDRL